MLAEDQSRHKQKDITEEYSFDELAMGLATGTLTRSRVLKFMGATLLGGLGAIAGTATFVDNAEAKQKKNEKKKKNEKRKKKKKNKPTQTANLIVNGDAESGPGGDGTVVVPVPGWMTSGNFTVIKYSTGAGFPTPTDPGPPNRGENFFGGGPDSASSSATQSINVSSSATAIDAGKVAYGLSGYLGGFGSQEDNAVLTITFNSATNAALGTASIGPVTATDRNNATGLLPRATSGIVPAGTRQIDVLLQMTRTGGNSNDGYADNLALVLIIS
jgi:hypothetical protein